MRKVQQTDGSGIRKIQPLVEGPDFNKLQAASFKLDKGSGI